MAGLHEVADVDALEFRGDGPPASPEELRQRHLEGGRVFVDPFDALVSWIASHVALRAVSLPAQYAALAGFVVAEALIFVPLLAIAFIKVPGAVQSAAAVTAVGFVGLTLVAFLSRKDFSFLGAVLR